MGSTNLDKLMGLQKDNNAHLLMRIGEGLSALMAKLDSHGFSDWFEKRIAELENRLIGQISSERSARGALEKAFDLRLGHLENTININLRTTAARTTTMESLYDDLQSQIHGVKTHESEILAILGKLNDDCEHLFHVCNKIWDVDNLKVIDNLKGIRASGDDNFATGSGPLCNAAQCEEVRNEEKKTLSERQSKLACMLASSKKYLNRWQASAQEMQGPFRTKSYDGPL